MPSVQCVMGAIVISVGLLFIYTGLEGIFRRHYQQGNWQIQGQQATIGGGLLFLGGIVLIATFVINLSFEFDLVVCGYGIGACLAIVGTIVVTAQKW